MTQLEVENARLKKTSGTVRDVWNSYTCLEVSIDVKRQRRFDQGLWFWIGSPSLNTWGKGAIGYAVKTYHYILYTIKNGSR